MSQEALVDEIRKLKKALEELEKRLATDEVPLAVLEDFKMVVDHTRMTVWAILSAGQSDQPDLPTQISHFRLKRIMDMCRQVMMDIESATLGIDSAELRQLQPVLRDTLARIERLYKSGM